MSRDQALRLSEKTLIPAGVAMAIIGMVWFFGEAYYQLQAQDRLFEQRLSAHEARGANVEAKLDKLIDAMGELKGDVREMKGTIKP